MAIKVVCRCGKQFQVTDDSAGQKAKCPQCGDILVIPNERVLDHLEVVEDTPSVLYRCVECGRKFPVTDLVDERGDYICRECLGGGATEQDTGIEVNASFFPLGWTLYFTKPIVEIDNREHSIPWWRTEFFPLRPGRHQVRCFVNWLGFGTGMKKIEVRVRPNRITHVRYQHMIWWAELTTG